MDDRPTFCKFFIPELCSRRMQIPPAFTCCLKRRVIIDAAFLRDHRGNVWPVEISREGRDIFFDKGWVRFVKDNCVDDGDFLVFELRGKSFFDFKHFGRNACEKEKYSGDDDDDVQEYEGEEVEEEEDDDDNEEELEVNEEKKQKESTRG